MQGQGAVPLAFTAGMLTGLGLLCIQRWLALLLKKNEMAGLLTALRKPVPAARNFFYQASCSACLVTCRREILTAVSDSKRPDIPYRGGLAGRLCDPPTDSAESSAAELNPSHVFAGGKAEPTPPLDFWIPPPEAIAHHLLHAWASRDEPWFPNRAGSKM